MADDKKELARAGTIEITSKEGKAFLEKNLTEWKKPLLMDQFEKDEKVSEDEDDTEKKPAGDKRKKGAKGGAAAAKKPKITKANTMAVTAKEGAELLGGEKLGDTRLMTKVKAKPASAAATKRTNTMAKTLEEAKALCGTVNSSEGRKLRKRSAPPPPAKKTPVKMKKAGTMVKTAKEGRDFVKRSRQRCAKTAS